LCERGVSPQAASRAALWALIGFPTGATFNTSIATAIADRLVENSKIFLLGGDSLRKASKKSSPPEE